MTNEITSAMADLWKLANKLSVVAMYNKFSRNPDKAIRDQFKTDIGIIGTHAWAIEQVMRMRNPETKYSDNECAAISMALQA